MAVSFHRFDSAEKAEFALLNELRACFSGGAGYAEAGDRPDGRSATTPFVVMLPGGSTPLRIYGRIAADPPSYVRPTLHLMLSDDRHVDPTSSDSNYGHIKPMADALRLDDSRLLHPRADLSLDDAARRYGDEIADLETNRAHLALAVLGIGGDGHTASLFTSDRIPLKAHGYAGGGRRKDDPSEPHHRTVAVTDRPDFQRVSASADLILRFRRIIFFATGAGKHDILYEISRRPEDYPAGRIAMQHGNTEIWTDQGVLYE